MRRLVFVLLFLLSFSSLALAASGDTTIIVIRHAEKAQDDPKDPSLSEAGIARGQALAKVLADHPLSAGYATQYRRTQLTAEPALQARGLKVQLLPVTMDNASGYGDALAKLIRSQHRGQTVLVVGHSNTVPGIVLALSGVTIAPIEESEFDRIYVITLPHRGKPALLALRY